MTGRYRFSQGRLEDVAELFREGEQREMIAQRLGVVRRTVDRYIAEARAQGMLPPGVRDARDEQGRFAAR
jgi:DNA-binding transcriptional regulator LsrR (DeoR family)